MRQVTFSEKVRNQLQDAGLLDKIDSVLSKSAIVTHKHGNRRYHHWIFRIVDGALLSVHDTRQEAKKTIRNHGGGNKCTGE